MRIKNKVIIFTLRYIDDRWQITHIEGDFVITK